MLAFGGGSLVLCWAMVATAFLAADRLGSQTPLIADSATAAAFEQRLESLSAERDARAAEARDAQKRFDAALDQVSRMQDRLLAAEQHRRELEAGIGVLQASLDDSRAALPAQMADATDGADAEAAAPGRGNEVSVALDSLTDELREASAARLKAEQEASEATSRAQALEIEKDTILARNDQILAQVEDVMATAIQPFDSMFAATGLDTDKLLETVRDGYSGVGGPLTPVSRSTRGDAAITESEARAREVMVSLDQLTTYRIAATKLPLSMPLKAAFRYSSPFGKRWGRMHAGVDMAAPTGTAVYATGDGKVTFAGWQRGYGNVIKIEHELGTETRYGHLSKIHVKTGQQVSRGARIGDIGNTGRSTGPHLHYEVRVNGSAVNPLSFIKAAENVF